VTKEFDGQGISSAVEELVEEMRGADLGDERRNARLLEVMRLLGSNPSGSFASMSGAEKEREGLYRFLRNEHVAWEEILKPHFENTFKRARDAKRVLAIHDTSAFRLPDDANLESYIQTGKRGFYAHASMLVSPDDRNPLGVGAIELFTRPKKQRRTKKKGRKMSGSETHRLEGRESLRWSRAVDKVENALEGVEIIHVMDREGDSYELFSKLIAEDASFVIRWCKDRNSRMPGDEEWRKVSELLDQASTIRARREVMLGKRKAKTAPDANKASPARRKREASLCLSFCTLVFKKPAYLPLRDGFPTSLTVQVVRVHEPDPPAGEEPIEWVLLTNLPVTKAHQVEEIVDIYRQRWMIEEFFKALKTGCSYRKRNLTNAQSILNSFATLTPVAWKALALRWAAQQSGDEKAVPASHVLDSDELAVLRAKAETIGEPLPPCPTAPQALLVIASLGGYRKSSGPPGWLTILRGLEKQQTLVDGWRLAGRGEM